MVDNAQSVEWIITESEVAAVMLEFSLIKRHRPRFNIKLVDDKSYPYLAITRSDEWPRARVMQGAKRKGNEYFGPYAHTYAIRKTLDQLLRTFPVRTCTDSLFGRQRAQGRPCLLYHIEKCSVPASTPSPRRTISRWSTGLRVPPGGHRAGVDRSPGRMWEASERQEFELAARHRDRIDDVRRALLRQEVVSERLEDFDLIAFHGDDLESAFQILHVRRGRLVGRLGTVVDRVEVLTDAELMGRVIRQLYGEDDPPRQVLVEIEPAEGIAPGMAGGAARDEGELAGTDQGLEATPHGDHGYERRRGVRGTVSSAARITSESQGASLATGGPRPSRAAPSHRSVRHLDTAGHEHRFVDGRARRRVAQAV